MRFLILNSAKQLPEQQILAAGSQVFIDGLVAIFNCVNYFLPTIKMLTVGPPEKTTKMERNKWTNTNQDPEKETRISAWQLKLGEMSSLTKFSLSAGAREVASRDRS